MTGKGTDQRSWWARWHGRVAAAVTILVLVVATYFILAAFIPRWWAQRIADMSGHGSFAKGIGSGLALGAVCTGVPLLLLMFAVLLWRSRAGRFLAGALTLLALIVALPNLMTLSIVLGTSDSAHAGERVLDVDAPGFRGASAIGSILAAAVFLVIVFFVARGKRRKLLARRQQAADTAEKDAATG